MVIDIEAKEYTQAEAEALLNYLYRYFHDRPRGEGEAGEMVTRLQEWGFAGFTKVLETIINSDEMKGRVRREFDQLWIRYFSHVPEPSNRRHWEGRLRHGRARVREKLEEEFARKKAELAKAIALIESHNHVEAQRVLEAAIADRIADWYFYHQLGRALHGQGRYLEAMPHYMEAIERSPDDDWPWSCNDLKDIYEHSGLPDRFERGLEYFKTVIDRFPNRWVAYHECGWMCWQSNLLDEAIPYYKQALALRKSDPQHLPSWGWTAHDLFEVYRGKGQLTDAYAFFSSISADHPQDWAIWYARASLERDHLGDTDLAIESYRQAVESKAPTWVLNEFGWYLRDLGRSERALQVFSEATSRDPEDWGAWHGAGWILKGQEDWKKAKHCFEKALRRNPQYAWSWFGLGFVYQNLASDPLNAVNAWEAYARTLVVDAANENAHADARKAQAELANHEIPWWKSLRQFIDKAYSLEEVRTLCFDLGIEYDNLVEGKSSRIAQLIELCQRRPGKMLALIQQLHEERPEEFPPLIVVSESRS